MGRNSQALPTNLGFALILSTFMFSWGEIHCQTTFIESGSAYGLNLGGNKDDGHALVDYDLNGDCDMVMNTNGNRRLTRNDG